MKKTCKLKNEKLKLRLMELGNPEEWINLDTLSREQMKTIIREVLTEEFRKELFD